MAKKKKKHDAKKETVHLVLKIILVIICALGCMVYFLLPALSDFRNSVYGVIIDILIVVLMVLFAILTERKRMSLLGKITIAAFAVLSVVCFIFNFGKIEALFFFIYAVVNIFISFIIYLNRKDDCHKTVSFFGLLSYLTSIIFVLRVEYINDKIAFLMPSIIFAVIGLIIGLIYGINAYKTGKERQNVIFAPLCGIMMGFLITWITLYSMNVYLDRSSPTYEEYVIVDKDVRAGARRPATYELKLKKGDTSFRIGVSEVTYYDYEINDKITLSLYSGAFGEPYYIHEKT